MGRMSQHDSAMSIRFGLGWTEVWVSKVEVAASVACEKNIYVLSVSI